jgi:hypothetical protein
MQLKGGFKGLGVGLSRLGREVHEQVPDEILLLALEKNRKLFLCREILTQRMKLGIRTLHMVPTNILKTYILNRYLLTLSSSPVYSLIKSTKNLSPSNSSITIMLLF